MLIGDLMVNYNLMLIVVSIIGGLILRTVCFIQSDIKMLVAYSSIVHISIVLAGLLRLKELGLNGSVYIIVGHGFCSSGLFCVLGVTYKRSLSRRIIINKGFLSVVPICSF